MQLTWTSVNPLDVSGPEKVSHNASKATSPFRARQLRATVSATKPRDVHTSPHQTTIPRPISQSFCRTLGMLPICFRQRPCRPSLSLPTLLSGNFQSPSLLSSTFPLPYIRSVPSLFHILSSFHFQPFHLSLPLRFYMWRKMRSSIISCSGRGWQPRDLIPICSTHCGIRQYSRYVIGSKPMRLASVRVRRLELLCVTIARRLLTRAGCGVVGEYLLILSSRLPLGRRGILACSRLCAPSSTP